MNTEEYLDLVDESDNVIGSEKRTEIYKQKLHNYRVINAFIVSNEGKLWIPRRTAHKAISPLALDFSVGGHVVSGDTYENTFKKETSEELNIDIDRVSWKELGHFKAGDFGLNCFMKVYEIKQNDVPVFNPDDFTEYYWLSPEEVIDRIENGDKSKGDLPILIKQLYLK